jgi:ABC-type transport system substrate-binding protein
MKKLEQRRAQVFLLGWVADYPDAENFLQLFYGPNGSPGANHCNYANPEFDRLYERLRVLPEGPGKLALCKQMTDLVIADCPWVFLHHPRTYALQHTWVRNYKVHDFPYGMIKYYAIDTAGRQARLARAP